MECKWDWKITSCATISVLIGTLWNVNLLVEMNYKIAIFVLIGTLWNVNVRIQRIIRMRYFVLIGTLWNYGTPA